MATDPSEAGGRLRESKSPPTSTPDFRGAQTIQKRFATTVLFLIAVFPPLVTALWPIYRLVFLLRSGREPRLTSDF